MNTSGDQGSFQKDFNVYQRENKKCLKYSCKGTIHKKFISNRSSFFCNLCQKLIIIVLTQSLSEDIHSRLWRIQNQQLNVLEKLKDKQLLTDLERAVIEVH